MNLITSLILIFAFVLIYIIFIEIYTVLFRITGVSKDKAKFQSISLLSNCGYTTQESEIITSNKVRRKIALANMITGNAFSVIIVSLLINLLNELNQDQIKNSLAFVFIIIGSFLLLLILFNIPKVKKGFDYAIEVGAIKILMHGKNENIINIIDNYGECVIAEVYLKYMPVELKDTPISSSPLRPKYGINIMVVKRNKRNISVTPDTILKKDDLIVLYGKIDNIKAFFNNEYLDTSVESQNIRENTINVLENFGKKVVVEIDLNVIPLYLQNKYLYLTNLKPKYDLLIMLITRDEAPISINKNTIIKQNDKLLIFGDLDKVRSAFIDDINLTE